jgi:hypothetical protein
MIVDYISAALLPAIEYTSSHGSFHITLGVEGPNIESKREMGESDTVVVLDAYLDFSSSLKNRSWWYRWRWKVVIA